MYVCIYVILDKLLISECSTGRQTRGGCYTGLCIVKHTGAPQHLIMRKEKHVSDSLRACSAASSRVSDADNPLYTVIGQVEVAGNPLQLLHDLTFLCKERKGSFYL